MAADMTAQLAALERQIAANRDRLASASVSFRADVNSFRVSFHRNVSREEDLAALKKQLRDLEADLAQGLSLKLDKELKCELMRASISTSAATSAATNERLMNLVAFMRNRRYQHPAIVSRVLEEEAQPEAQPVQLVPPRPPQVQANLNEQEGAEGLEPDFHPEELQGQSGGEDGRGDLMELYIVPSPPSMRKQNVRSRGKRPAADGSGRAAQRPRTNEAPEQGGSVAQITAADKLQSKDSGRRGRGRPTKRGRIGKARIFRTSRKNDPEFQETRAKEAAASRKVVKEAALSKKRAKKALKKRAT